MQTFDVIIAGGGVAGLSAAVFLARAGIRVALFDQAESSLYRVSKVNNFLGFPEGVAGPELLQLGKHQAQRFGAVVIDERIDSVASVGGRFEARAGGNEYGATYLIIASKKRTDLARSLRLQPGGHGTRL